MVQFLVYEGNFPSELRRTKAFITAHARDQSSDNFFIPALVATSCFLVFIGERYNLDVLQARWKSH